jgi:hypothetical protein
MINEIIIRLDDEGRYVLHLGNSMPVITTNESELLGFIYEQVDNLAYFPNGKWDMNKQPISIGEFRKKYSRPKVRRKIVKDILD